MLEALVVAAVVAFAACVQTAAGMGFALILSPVLLALLAPKPAILLITALGLTLNTLVLVTRRSRPLVAWAEVMPMLLAAIPGSLLGLLVLEALSKAEIELAVGALVVAMALARLRPRGAETPSAPPSGRLLVGLLAGVLSTASGLNGPPLAMWLSSRPIEFRAVRDSLAAIFLGTGVISAATLVPALGGARPTGAVVALGFGGLLAGRALGGFAHDRLAPARLRSLLTLVILASGVSAVTLGAFALA